MNFNFDATANVGTNSQLSGNDIYEVTFDGCEARDIKGVQDPNKTFKVLDIKFSSPYGNFIHTVWEPREEDFEDREGPYGKNPSNVLAMMLLFKHLIDAVNPTLGAEINEKKKSLSTSSWDSLRKLIIDSTSSGVGTKTKIKLIKNNKGEAIFPYFATYNRNGQLTMRTQFIGNNIMWQNWELDKITKSEVAKPNRVDEKSDTPNYDFTF